MINGGAFFFLRLPHSGLELDLPVIGTFPKTPEPDEGLMPDVVVPATVADIAVGRDGALAAIDRMRTANRQSDSIVHSLR